MIMTAVAVATLAVKSGGEVDFTGKAALVISIIALAVSVAALLWQVLNYLLTGQRVRIDVTGMNVYATAPPKKLEPMVQIGVSAIGRVPVEVKGWALVYPRDMVVHSEMVRLQYGTLSGVFLGDDLPKVIEPGRSASFNFPTVMVTNLQKEGLDPITGHLWVYFSARRSKKVRKSIGELVRLPDKTPAPADPEVPSLKVLVATVVALMAVAAIALIVCWH